MTNTHPAARRRGGPALATFKVFMVLFGLVILALAVLAAIGLAVGPAEPPSPERIRQECEDRFAWGGEQAVAVCVIELNARLDEEERERLLDEAYRGARRGGG